MMKEMIGKFPQEDIRFEGYLRLGLLYVNQKRYDDAISALSQALRSPEERVAAQAQVRLGEAYLGAGNKEMAILQFSKAVYLYPHIPEILEEALIKLGPLYMEQKKMVEAKQVYRKLLEKTKREDRKAMAKKMLDQIGP
jgi:tetratricopeptide (TPR) repeat protein